MGLRKKVLKTGRGKITKEQSHERDRANSLSLTATVTCGSAKQIEETTSKIITAHFHTLLQLLS